MKINGTEWRKVNVGTNFEFTVYRVRLVGGPMGGVETMAGNTTVVFCAGHRYELNANGDFVYSPEASTGGN